MTPFTVEWDGDSRKVQAYDEKDAAERFCRKAFWAMSPGFPKSFENVVVKANGHKSIWDVRIEAVPEFTAFPQETPK